MQREMKWPLKSRRLSVCFVLTFLSTVRGEVVYLHAQRNSSIEFSCVAPEEPGDLFAFSLIREWLQSGKVLYHNFKTEPNVIDSTFKDRIFEQVVADDAPKSKLTPTSKLHRVNVSIMLLQGYDTDMYACVFHYDTPTGFKNLSGRSKLLLYVEDYHIEQCSCYSYTPLLFSLSAAAGLLFLIILILTAVHCRKPSRGGQMKPQLSVPIYEEMNGVREKVSSRPQEEDVSSLYVRPKNENPYSN